jgi:hypothetical protein
MMRPWITRMMVTFICYASRNTDVTVTLAGKELQFQHCYMRQNKQGERWPPYPSHEAPMAKLEELGADPQVAM